MTLMRATVFLSTTFAILAAAACSANSKSSFGGSTSNTVSGSGGEGGDVFVTDGSSGAGGDAACAKSVTEAELEPANILFVIDRSGSMNCNPPPLQSSSACELNPTPKDPNKPTRWQIVAAALKDTIAKMPPTTNVGISYFSTDSSCGVTQQPAVAIATLSAPQLDALEASIDAVKPKGATPIVGAVTLGYKHLFEDVKLPGNSFVVLLTDGAETCAPQLQDKLVDQTVPAALSVKIRTFVIGAPGSDPARSLLSRVAWAGGTANDPQCKHPSAPANVGDCHFDMTDPNLDFATELNAALKAITGTALSCELEVPSAVGEDVDYDKVNVTFTPSDGPDVPLLQDNQPCASGSGWQYNADKTKILICGETCDLVKADTKGKITIELGCATMVAK